jgi:hypothetical protein
MIIAEENRPLSLSTDIVKSILVEDVLDYAVDDAIVLNLSPRPVQVGSHELCTVILPWKSARLFNVSIAAADRLAIFKVRKDADLNVLAKEWDWFGLRLPTFPQTTRLHISPIDSVGQVNLDLSAFAGRNFDALGARDYEIRLNLWFAPAGTDCGIHNTHDFLEIHTQIAGTGRVEKFQTENEATRFEELFLTEGFTHQFYGNLSSSGHPTYCWHRYIAETDCVWLAIEFHPVR